MIRPALTWLLLLPLSLPWLIPMGGAPTPALQPWFASVICGLLLWLWRSRLNVRLIQWGWLLAAVLSAALGLVQYAGLTHNLEPWLAQASPGEAYGNLRQRNQFATLMNIGLASVLWLVVQGESCARHTLWARRGLAAAVVLLTAGTAASLSRTGLVQLVALAGLLWFYGGLKRTEGRKLLALALGAYVLAAITLPLITPQSVGTSVWMRLSQGDGDCGGRLTLWRNVAHLITIRPWLGWGWGELDYAHFMTLYEGRRFCAILGNAHHLPLHLAVELGLPAMLAVCVPGWLLVWRARPWRESNVQRQYAWVVLALILLHSLVEYPLWFGPFQLVLLVCLWLLSRGRTASQRRPELPREWSRRHDLALATIIVASVSYAVWDYHRVSQIFLAPERRAERYREHTMEKIRDSWLFRDQVRFAEFVLTPLNRGNAAQLHALGLGLLHYSPEPRVVEKLIESAELLGKEDEAQFYLARYRAAYPDDYARWAARQVDSQSPTR